MGGVLCAVLPVVWAQDDAARPDVLVQAVSLAETGTPVETTAPLWELHRGVPIHTQLQAWASRSGWILHWQPKVSWLVAGDAGFDGSFEDALKEVVEGLFFEGKPIRLVLWEGNRLAEVIPIDVR